MLKIFFTHSTSFRYYQNPMKRYLFAIAFLTLMYALPALAAKSSGISRLGFAIQMGAFADVKNAERCCPFQLRLTIYFALIAVLTIVGYKHPINVN